MEEQTSNLEENPIKKACDDLQITQKDLAEKIGVSNNTISSWKNNKQPMPKWAYKLLKFVRIEKDYNILMNLIRK